MKQSMYPAEKLRDPEWLKTMSQTPSIMDYSRFNRRRGAGGQD